MSYPISIIVSTFHPFPTLSFSLSDSTPLSSLPSLLVPLLPLSSQSLSTRSGKSITSITSGTLKNLFCRSSDDDETRRLRFLELRLVPKVLGGKGGFGSQLRAAGGRMSSQKTQNNDSCRDLSGRRLSTIKEAQKLAAAIASEPERQETKRKEALERLAALNQEINRLDALVNGNDESNIKKRRLNDSQQLAESKEGIEKVRSAVAMALLNKKKQQKKKKDQEVMEKKRKEDSEGDKGIVLEKDIIAEEEYPIESTQDLANNHPINIEHQEDVNDVAKVAPGVVKLEAEADHPPVQSATGSTSHRSPRSTKKRARKSNPPTPRLAE